ncbi:ATP-dependent helicase [Candidatus Woesearchaeota archaeon]|nr:ATP-dependent helicase [Candidatus Woesearchaeota archaeon]
MITTIEHPNTKEELDNILNPLVKKWFYSRFSSYSLPQLFGVMKIHSRENVLVSAPTGATKSLTSFMSVLNELVDSSIQNVLEKKIYCVYVSPLKSLNNDVERNLSKPLEEMNALYGKDLGIRVMVRTGDTTTKEKSYMLKNPPHILITTPESLSIMLASKKFKENFSNVEWVIVDEIHSFAENKRGVSLSLSLEFLQKISPGICRVGLSATVSPIEEVAKFLVGTNRDCKIVDVNYIKGKDIDVLTPVDDFLKYDYDFIDRKLYALIDKLIQEHKTTLIFTNTRSATEKVVNHLVEKFPGNYSILEDGKRIGAHHSSLSKEHRLEIEQGLREGKLKCVVCSTSLELGIDIGYIDLVILLGSPKSVARGLQRIGRAGHQLKSVTKGRIVVLDRDDLVECAILLKNSLETKIDRIHIPRNSLDVLAQAVIGSTFVFSDIVVKDLFDMVKESYCYSGLKYEDFFEIIEYLSGEYIELEKRHFYAKIRFDKETRMIMPKGKLGRVLYMTNAGTIPDSSGVSVKIGENVLGVVEEAFAENLRAGDIFVLGGSCYRFKFTRGQTMQVAAADGRKPTVPNWFSQMLPLSFDLALDIGRFRRLVSEKINDSDVVDFIRTYTGVSKESALAIFQYFAVQAEYALIPSDREILIEEYYDSDFDKHYFVFHALFGRRVLDCLSRAVAFAIGRKTHNDVEIGLNDNGFYVAIDGSISLHEVKSLFMYLATENLYDVMKNAIESTEILARRFRHCASRSFLILRNYMGNSKNVGRQQVSSKLIYNAVRSINENFVIIKEARREVLEDVMDVENATKVLQAVKDNKIKVLTITTQVPSPFATNLVLQGFSDVLKASDRLEFLKNMHNMVLAKISLKPKTNTSKFSYDEFWTRKEEDLGIKEFENIEKIRREFKEYAETHDVDLLFVKDMNKIFVGDYHKVRTKTYDFLESLLSEDISESLKKFVNVALIEISKVNEEIVK